MSAISLPIKLTDDHLQAGFLRILPRIERHARIYFRDVQCAAKRQDLIAETIALTWSWYRRLMKKGKDASKFVSALARFAARAVSCGRKLTGQEKAKDVLSSVAQKRHGFKVESLPASTRTSLEKIYSEVKGQQDRDAWRLFTLGVVPSVSPQQWQRSPESGGNVARRGCCRASWTAHSTISLHEGATHDSIGSIRIRRPSRRHRHPGGRASQKSCHQGPPSRVGDEVGP